MALSSPQGWLVAGGGGRPGRLHLLYRLGLCLAAFTVLAVAVFGIAPALPRFVHIQEQIDILKESGIQAGAIFYTDVEHVPEMVSVIEGAIRATPSPAAASSAPGLTGR